jgi:hypothetical protein
MSLQMNIQFDATGVKQVVARPTSVSEANEAGALSAKTALPVRLLHESLKENDGANDKADSLQQFIWVPRDPEIPVFEQVQLGLAEPITDIDSNDLPKWLIDALKRAHPRHFVWANVEELDGGDSEAAWQVLQDYELDHAGVLEDEKRGIVLVTEPYAMSRKQVGNLMCLVSDAELEMSINGISNHAPSRTFRIEIWKA